MILQRSERAIPIVGARTPDQIRDNLGAVDLQLSEAHFETLERVSRRPVGWPHYFFGSRSQKGFTYGDVLDDLDTSRAIPFRGEHPSPPDHDPFGLGWEEE